MRLDEISVEVRDSSLRGLGQFVESDLVGFTAIPRFNDVGSWKCSLPANHVLGRVLRTPGSGLIVSVNGQVLLSGPTTTVVHNREVDDPDGVYDISGVDDSIVLKDSLAFPTPSTDNLDAQVNAYDERSGLAENVMKAYVRANIGDLAPVARRRANLVIPTSSGLGGSVTGSARFETLYELISGFAETSGLGFNVVQVGSKLEFQVFKPTDRSRTVRLDLLNGRLTKSEFSFAAPKVTNVIVGGTGEGADRIFLERTSGKSVAASEDWGRRIEVFDDQRSTAEEDKLFQSADELLSKDGSTLVSVSVTPTDDTTMLLGRDWNLGDMVSCVVGDIELISVVSELGISVQSDGVRLVATIGQPNGLDFESQLLSRQTGQASRISRLERI